MKIKKSISVFLAIIITSCLPLSINNFVSTANDNITVIDGVEYQKLDDCYRVAGITNNNINEITIQSEINGENVLFLNFQGSYPKPLFMESNIQKINIKSNNKNYYSIDGVVYSKDGKQLVCYPTKKLEKSFKIPDGVKIICDGAFGGNDNLENIYISSSVSKFTSGSNSGYISPFYGCKNLKQFEVDKLNKYFFEQKGILYSKSSDYNELYYCPENFEGEFTLPANSIIYKSGDDGSESNAFENCPKLTGINVNSDNKSYSSIDGILFNKDKTEIYVIPRGKNIKSYTIPDSVTEFGLDFCCYNDHIEELHIPQNANLKFAFAFYGSPKNLKDVYYSGTKSEWQSKFGNNKFYIINRTEIHPIIHCVDDNNNNSTLKIAKIYGISIILSQSDPNKDGRIDASDATLVLIDYANRILNAKHDYFDNSQADSNDDGVIDAADATNILIYYANILQKS